MDDENGGTFKGRIRKGSARPPPPIAPVRAETVAWIRHFQTNTR
jgi:hypothetical protein